MPPDRDPPLWRSHLVTPASQPRMIAKSAALQVDAVVLDLEDGVAAADKATARAALAAALGLDWQGRAVGVRINGLDTPWLLHDLLALEGLALDSVILPKVHRPEDVVVVDQILRQLSLQGARAAPAIQAMIESARGLEAVAEIASASPSLAALIFGAGDYAADAGVAMNRRGLDYARSRIAAAAAAAGILAIDYVHPRFDDDAGLAEQVAEARDLGFAGKWAIHPRQVPIIERGFSPTPGELAEAQRILAACDTGTGGATARGALMVDEAVLRIMRRRVTMAQRSGAGA